MRYQPLLLLSLSLACGPDPRDDFDDSSETTEPAAEAEDASPASDDAEPMDEAPAEAPPAPPPPELATNFCEWVYACGGAFVRSDGFEFPPSHCSVATTADLDDASKQCLDVQSCEELRSCLGWAEPPPPPTCGEALRRALEINPDWGGVSCVVNGQIRTSGCTSEQAYVGSVFAIEEDGSYRRYNLSTANRSRSFSKSWAHGRFIVRCNEVLIEECGRTSGPYPITFDGTYLHIGELLRLQPQPHFPELEGERPYCAR